MPGHWALANVHFEIFDIQIILEHMFINKNLPFRVVYTHRYSTQQKKMFFLLFSRRVHQKNAHVRVVGHRALAKVHDEIIYILLFFEHLFLKKSHIFKWPVSQILRKKHDCVINFLSY